MEPLRDLTSDPMDPLLVVTQLRDLASDPMNRRAIVQDQGCLPGLILFLDHPNPQVVYCALQDYLVDAVELKHLQRYVSQALRYLRWFIEILKHLSCVPRRSGAPVPEVVYRDTETPLLCSQALRYLRWFIEILKHLSCVPRRSGAPALRYLSECRWNQEKLQGELGMMLSLQSVIQNSTTPGETRLLPEERLSSRRRAQFFLGSNNKRAKTVTLHIQGLDDWSRRSQCSEALLRTRGVISFTFKMIQRRCIVRIQSELRAEVLASAIASTQVMKALQVVRGENGEEVLVPLEEEGSGSDQDQELPDYLPEDESPSVDPEQALTQGRSERGGSRWLGAASNFLSRSFYW
ncbi:hypothetical protein JOQ06_023022 [Pogonophryne albipinna]|uniref:Armadillo repeat-containing protein 1 n=1 Tax=Pogonophryne albipinna TaxID=1090488 RepID=A0AAD6A739_9TELE|nr:hypothetical protein JOQ06_023022 [Pogonophryne albipinna]